MNPRRQLDLHGSVSARDRSGRILDVQCDGSCVKLDASSAGAALAALSSFRCVLASAGLSAPSPATAFAIARLGHFQVDLRIRGRNIGLAGRGARPNWLGRWLTRMPIEVHWTALMRALFTGF